MTYYLLDFTKKEQKFDFNNLIFGKKINSDQNYSKYYMYYNDNDNASEIYIKLPKIRTIYYLGNNKFNSINLPIYPEYDITNKFITFIKNLENNIDDNFKKKNKEFISLITKKKSLQFIRMNINDNIKIISNTNKKILLNEFKLNSQIEVVIKLSYIWMNQTKLGISSQIYQINYYAPPEQLEISFIEDNISSIPKETVLSSEPITFYPITKPQLQITQNNIIIRPSLLDINNALKSLKKIDIY